MKPYIEMSHLPMLKLIYMLEIMFTGSEYCTPLPVCKMSAASDPLQEGLQKRDGGFMRSQAHPTP